MAMAMASAATMPSVEPSQVPASPSRVASVMVASMVLSPSSARKKARLAASTALLVDLPARAASSSLSESLRSVQAANPRNASPASRFIGRAGSAAPSSAPTTTETRWTTAVAAVIPASTGRAR
jgi:hypothetical protein